MINYRELGQMLKLEGKSKTCQHFAEALEKGQLKANDFNIRDLYEATVPDGREALRLLDPRNQGSFTFQEEGSAVDTSVFANISGQIVFSKVLEAAQNEEFKLSKMVPHVSTSFKSEKIPGVTGLGDVAEVIGEGQNYPSVGFSEDYIETSETKKRGFKVEITKEAIFFDRTNLVLSNAQKAGEALGMNKEKRIVDAMIDLNSTAHRHKWKGTTYATYQTSTPWINKVTSNELVDWSDIDKAMQAMNNMVDPNTGEPILVTPKHVVVAPGLSATLMRILNATEVRHGDGASATVQTISSNPISGLTPVVSRYLGARLVAGSGLATSWFLCDLDKFLAYYENYGITMEQAPPNSHDSFNRDIAFAIKVGERGAVQTIEPRASVCNTVA
jgi:hypothetical protein